jgi:Terpene synthase family 2, C-terminal metal binding
MSVDTMLHDAFEAIPPQLNPHADDGIEHLRQWVREYGLITASTAAQRFERAEFGRFAAMTYPTADRSGIGIIADWFAWLFLLDDQLDDGIVGKDRDAAAALLGAILGVLQGSPADPGAPAIVSCLADLWSRTTADTDDVWRKRFVDHVVAGGMAAVWEADNRVNGVVPTEASYIDKRRHTGAIYVCMDLIEIVEHVVLPDEVHSSPAFTAALDAASDVVCWTNDLYSLDKETALGEHHNLVTVSMHERGISEAEATDLTASRIADRLQEYLRYEPAVLAAWPAHRRELEAYLAGMRSWMRGNFDWSAGTRRYLDSPDPADYLESRIVRQEVG